MKLSRKLLTAILVIAVIGIFTLVYFIIPKDTNAENSDDDFIIDQTLNDGTFYLNGDIDSVKFVILNDNLQLILEDKETMQDLYNIIADNNESFKANFTLDDWYEQISIEWSNPKPYIIHQTGFGELNVAWDIVYDQEDGSLVGYLCGDYIDENNFDYNDCRFTRIM